MALPQPEPGLVIHYEYLWRHEHLAGNEQGSKERPCAIVVAAADKLGDFQIVVAPITHSMPVPPTEGVEIPARVNAHLGLDEARSWVVTTDLNIFTWPGFDLRLVPGGSPRKFAYGFLPPKLFNRIRDRIAAAGGFEKLTRRTG